MEHYKGLWNRAYIHKGAFKNVHTYLGEYLSQNGTGQTVAVFKMKALKVKKGIAYLNVSGNHMQKTVQLKKNWISKTIV